ncbi:MAG: L-serine ammonia-lyase, iron-sulfur-dependent, subunit beta [Bacteroidetes bacterium]|nr:MAG: L-serine ammonia-lyase, iron-sulfur-dependent, subunit beta [Bacteroidota bacterium]
MSERSSIFDMIGPVMIGPSSSHTAGVARIGRVAHHLFGGQPAQVVITFYNSFSRTYEGHGSDRAILAGLLDMKPDDERLKKAPEHALAAGMGYSFRAVFNASDLHPNSIRIQMEGAGRQMNVLGVSRGGGLISIVNMDGFSCNFSAQVPTLIVTAEDIHGSAAFISSVIAYENCNIATMTVNRSGKNDVARLVLELDSAVRPLTITYLRSLTWVKEVIYLEGLSE